MDDRTKTWLAHLMRGGAFGHFWTLQGQQSTWFPTDAPGALPKGQRDIYVGVHPVTQIPPTNAKGEAVPATRIRSQLGYIAAINCLFSEFDAKDYGGDKDAALGAVQGLDPFPSDVIDSGGGYHCYWRLTEPWMLDSPERLQQAQRLQAAWVLWSSGDKQSKDLCRVLRVPGTLNQKYDPPRPVIWVSKTTEFYDIAELAALAKPFMETPAKPQGAPAARNGSSNGVYHASLKERRIAGMIQAAVARVGNAPDGTKHHTLLASARTLGGIQELDDQQILDILLPTIEQRADDPRKAAVTIADGIRYGRAAFWDLDDPPTAPAGQTNKAPATPNQPTPISYAYSARIMQTLTDLGYTFRLNVLDDTVEVNGQMMTDILQSELRMKLRDEGIKGMGAAEDIYVSHARQTPFHPIQDYLTGLQWDGQDHIAKLASYMESSDPPVTYPSGGEASLHGVYLYRWLIGAVAKIFEKGQNLMLVFAGPPDLGKSALARWLCSPLAHLYTEAPIVPDSRLTDLTILNTWIWECGELDGTTRKADVAALKAFLTRETVTTRKYNAHHDIKKPVPTSFIGTVNQGTGFLVDETGNRRFLVTSLTSLNWAYQREVDVNQVWAEAVHRYRAGEAWRLTDQEKQTQAVQNRNYEIGDPIEGWLEKHFHFGVEDDEGMTTADIIDHLQAREVRVSADRSWETRIGAALIRRGMRARQVRGDGGRRVRRYFGIIPAGTT